MFPAELVKKEMLGAAVEFVKAQPIEQKYKKYMLLDWTKAVGVDLTKDILDAAGIFEG